MQRSFRGEATNKVDQKGRVSVPASFRRVLEEGDPETLGQPKTNFVLLYGLPGGRRLEGRTIRGMEDLDAEIRKWPRFSRKRTLMERLLNAKSVYLQLDENGRIVLPQALREAAGLDGEAVFAGMGERFEVWSPEGYAANGAALDAALEDLGGEAAFEDMFAELADAGLGGGE